MHLIFGKVDAEAGSQVRLAVDFDRSSVLFHYPFNEAESKADALDLLRTRGIGAIKTFEDVGHGFRRDSSSVVRDAKNDLMVFAPAVDIHPASLGSVFDRVIDQIEHRAFQPLSISDDLEVVSAIELQRNFLFFRNQ